ncbi:MAG: 30S ribosomal protein S15 [Treponema sp.]|jgi:small subunit ribosomal protein S15|nr:30S ribosomal protein S15 [Treponema sp.]
MALNKEEVTSIITKYGKNERDTGDSEVQVAILTERINQLTEHRKLFKKDKSSQRAMSILVSKRRRLLKYVQRTDLEKYRSILKDLGLRK